MKVSIGAKPLIYPTPVLCVGSYCDDMRPNVMTAAWGGVACSAPPAVAISLRKATLTYGNIMKRRAFTISIPDEKHLKQAHYFGSVSGRAEDKFRESGMTAARAKSVEAPYVEEFPLVLECDVTHVLELGLHTMFIGMVTETRVDETVLKGGMPDVEAIRPLSFMPGADASYCSMGWKMDPQR
jgi:flavin reductase (DIM6/NTAB) family NADH-FMN oxidoreductase RutF